MSQRQNIIAISGGRSVGKSPFCQRIIERCQSAGLDVAGILSPARVQNGVKNGFFVIDLHSGEQRLLASKVPGELQTDTSFGPWSFDQRVFDWGNQNLRAITSCDLLVIDELGPLELKQGSGWSSALQALLGASYTLALVVVRPECLELLQQKVQISQTVYLDADRSADLKAEQRIMNIFNLDLEDG